MQVFRNTVVLALVLAFSGFVGCQRPSPPVPANPVRVPVQTTAPTTPTPVPANAVLFPVGDAATVTPPFARQWDETAGGDVLTLPEGAGSPAFSGAATFACQLPDGGSWCLWARTRWRDSCGNSLLVQADQLPAQTCGEDHVYDTWHWVRAGTWELAPGKHTLNVREREDGVELHQLLLSRDEHLVPASAFDVPSAPAAPWLFADYFDRSPGHGLESWQVQSGDWQIEFSFDPNRVPNQYALRGVAPAAGAAVILLQGEPWRGYRLRCACWADGPAAGGVVGDVTAGAGAPLTITLATADSKGEPRTGEQVVSNALRPHQWYRVELERWAWLARLRVDGQLVWENAALPPAGGRLGLHVAQGRMIFDDVEVEELGWQADDGLRREIPWQVGAGSEWWRPRRRNSGLALVGQAGGLSARWDGSSLREVWLETAAEATGECEVSGEGLSLAGKSPTARWWTAAAGTTASSLVLTATRPEAHIRRLAVRTGDAPEVPFRLGPYHFTRNICIDPGDYLDFTPAEYAAMARSPEADKLRRQPREFPLVSASDDSSPWCIHGGAWQVVDGVLRGTSPGAVRCWQDVLNDLELRLRLRLVSPNGAARIRLYAGPSEGGAVTLTRTTPDPKAPVVPGTVVQEDGEWHELIVSATGALLTVRRHEGQPPAWREVGRLPLTRTGGGHVQLEVVTGTVEFDDVEVLVPRQRANARLYAFDRRETDWLREGGEWLDHGGIACALASNWIALVAPKGEGWLRHKAEFTGDVAVGLTVAENTEWHGWNDPESHIHHPFDNVAITWFAGEDLNAGYRLVVNADQRRATILYRAGQEVLRRRQDGSFPLRYGGGHSPYSPRRSRVGLVRQGAVLRALVNGVEVLRYEDPAPLAVNRLAVGGFQTRINFSNIEVVPLPSPPTPPPASR